MALIEKRHERHPKVKTLRSAVEAGRGTAVRSQLLDSFEGIMRFVLAVVVEHGETTREDVADAFRRTLAHYHVNENIQFDRPFEDDMWDVHSEANGDRLVKLALPLLQRDLMSLKEGHEALSDPVLV